MTELATKKFAKNKEDFTCEHCGFFVQGTGYTNHCIKCLWSKHVDINPGDRQEACGGAMKPLNVEGSTSAKSAHSGVGYIIIHECQKCHVRRKNRVQKIDDMDAVIDLAKRFAASVQRLS